MLNIYLPRNATMQTMYTLLNWPDIHRRDKTIYLYYRMPMDQKKANRIKGNKWDDTLFEMSVDVYDDDINFIQSPLATSNDLQ